MWGRALFVTLIVLCAPTLAHAVNENDALALAVKDARTLTPVDRIFTRYIWISSGKVDDLRAVSLALNNISRGSVIRRPEPLGKDGLLVARVDLRYYAPISIDGVNRDLDDLIKQWEEFQFDGVFNQLITKDTLRFAGDVPIPPITKTVTEKVEVREPCPPYVSKKDGKTYDHWIVTKEVKKQVEVPFKDAGVALIRNVSPHLDPFAVGFLVNELRTQAPMVSHEYFIFRALSTIKDKGLFRDVYAGLYYDLTGIKTGAKKGTDLDVLLESLGIGNVEAGVGFAKVFDKIRSDRRVAVFRSGVTGKPRRTLILNTLIGRDSKGIVLITQDIRDQDVDIGTHPIMNLLALDSQAQEVIWETATGLHGFAIFDGQGKRVDEVPPDVAMDRTVPAPHTQRLQPAIGCIRCHGSEGGWRILKNDVTALIGAGKKLNVFNDLQDVKKSQEDVLDREAGLFTGNPEFTLLPRARDDYASAVLRATGPWPQSKDQTDAHKLAAERIAAIYQRFWYDQIDARKALLELGYTLGEKEDAAKKLRELVPPLNIVIDGVIPEDPRIAALQVGLNLNRPEWDLIRSFVATRISRKKPK